MKLIAKLRRHDLGLLVIAVLKLGYGIVLLGLGIGVLSLIHKDLTALVTHWADALEINSENEQLQKLLENVVLVRPSHLVWVSAITFFYSILSFAMGIGLLLERRWAEYLTATVTASFIPIEIYEIHRHVRSTSILVLTLNLLIVVYLVWTLVHAKPPNLRLEAGKGSG